MSGCRRMVAFVVTDARVRRFSSSSGPCASVSSALSRGWPGCRARASWSLAWGHEHGFLLCGRRDESSSWAATPFPVPLHMDDLRRAESETLQAACPTRIEAGVFDASPLG